MNQPNIPALVPGNQVPPVLDPARVDVHPNLTAQQSEFLLKNAIGYAISATASAAASTTAALLAVNCVNLHAGDPAQGERVMVVVASGEHADVLLKYFQDTKLDVKVNNVELKPVSPIITPDAH